MKRRHIDPEQTLIVRSAIGLEDAMSWSEFRDENPDVADAVERDLLSDRESRRGGMLVEIHGDLLALPAQARFTP